MSAPQLSFCPEARRTAQKNEAIALLCGRAEYGLIVSISAGAMTEQMRCPPSLSSARSAPPLLQHPALPAVCRCSRTVSPVSFDSAPNQHGERKSSGTASSVPEHPQAQQHVAWKAAADSLLLPQPSFFPAPRSLFPSQSAVLAALALLTAPPGSPGNSPSKMSCPPHCPGRRNRLLLFR
jgi:hypothetical protein